MPHDHHGHAHAQPQPTTLRTPSSMNPTTVAVAISERAATEIKNVMKAEGASDAALRLSVEPGGCAGYQYALSFADHLEPEEIQTESQGVKVFVHKQNVSMLNGLTIDYVDTPMGSGFNIKNPNAKSTCGCGISFSA